MSGFHTLVFETSTSHASLARITPEGTIERRDFTGDRSHNAALFAPLGELIDGCENQPIGLVLVGSGPGSYSGTRVGIAAAQGVALASRCAAAAVPSILGVPSAEYGAACLAIGDARRGSYWAASIDQCRLLGEPELMEADELEIAVEQAIAESRVVFSFENPDRFPLSPELKDQVRLEVPDAARLWRAWNLAGLNARTLWMACSPQPIYLKPPHITPAKRPWLIHPQP